MGYHFGNKALHDATLAKACLDAGVPKFVHGSSSSVYGQNPELPKHEALQTLPISPYAVAKLAGEGYCRSFSNVYGIETVALRYFNVFGRRQDPTSQYAAVVPRFIRAIASSLPILNFHAQLSTLAQSLGKLLGACDPHSPLPFSFR